MDLKPRIALAVLAILASISASTFAAPTFSSFVTTSDLNATLSNSAAIGFAYAGNKFVGSVYFGTNNNQLYQTNLSGGSVSTFGAPILGASGEIYVSSSLGLGGFGPRDVFAGPQSVGTVYRFNNDGTGQTPFVSGLLGGVRGIAFDPFGLYGNDMIVTTGSGNVYRVTSAGVVTLLANIGNVDTEGLSFTPQAFGPHPKGTLFVASDVTGNLNAVAPNGTVTFIANVPSAEMLSFVPLNLGISGDPLEGFYAANYALDVVKSPASDFVPYIGELVVTGETTHLLTDVKWNGSSSFLTSVIGSFPNQPEDGIFVTVDILKPGCSQTNTCGTVPEPATLALIGAAFAGLAFMRRRKQS